MDCESYAGVSPENQNCAWCDRFRINLDKGGVICSRCKLNGFELFAYHARQVCKHMQLQEYYASDCAKCRGKAIICSNPEVIEIHGKEARDVAIETKKASFPMHMSEKRCRPEACKFFEEEPA